MGRKPNAIVSEFFSRGAKLHDSSNRYEHTCKLCGQIFPKGRADSLLSHLIRTCQAISAADRERVEKLWPAQRGTRRMRTPRASQVTNPYLLRQTSMFNAGIGGLNGLNVLAEASRQVGASDDQHPEHPESAPEEALNISTEAGAPVIPQAKDQKPVLVDPALEAVTKPNIGKYHFHLHVFLSKLGRPRSSVRTRSFTVFKATVSKLYRNCGCALLAHGQSSWYPGN